MQFLEDLNFNGSNSELLLEGIRMGRFLCQVFVEVQYSDNRNKHNAIIRKFGDDSQGDNSSFQIITTEQFVRFDCYGGIIRGDINIIIDILLKYGCPLYDPQIGICFGGCD